MPAFEIAARNPFLVLVWSFGLFMLVHLHQYIGALLAAWRTRQTFDVIMGGKYEDHTTILMRGLAALAIGIPLTWIAATHPMATSARLDATPISWRAVSCGNRDWGCSPHPHRSRS